MGVETQGKGRQSLTISKYVMTSDDLTYECITV